MLLPPVLQLYMTKVEVTRDDTLTESSYDINGDGVMIKNLNFLDTLDTIKHDLLRMYLQRERTTVNAASLSEVKNSEEKISAPERRNQQELETSSAIDNDLERYMYQLNHAYLNVSNETISKHEYISQIELITDSIVALDKSDAQNKRNTKFKDQIENPANYSSVKRQESMNRAILKIFQHLNLLKYEDATSTIFRRLITSYEKKEFEHLRIKNNVIRQYELAKSKKSKNIKNQNKQVSGAISFNKLIKASPWIESQFQTPERFSRLVQIFTLTNQSKKSFRALIDLTLQKKSTCDYLSLPETRVSVVNALRLSNRTQEARWMDHALL